MIGFCTQFTCFKKWYVEFNRIERQVNIRTGQVYLKIKVGISTDSELWP